MRFYTAEEVAYRLDQDAESIRQLIRDRDLDGVKWSGQWIISNDDFKTSYRRKTAIRPSATGRQMSVISQLPRF